MASVSRRSMSGRSISTLLMCGGLLLAGQAFLVSSSSTVKSSSSACEELHRWARAYEGKSPTLDELASYDRPHRLAIFNAVSPAVRSALWQEQLRRFEQRADLSTTQHALVREAIALATAALYRGEPAAREAFQTFWSRAENAFPLAVHKRAWFDLGGRGDAARGGVTCNCNPSSVFADCGGGTCPQAGCNFTGGGCGPIGNLNCTGLCS
jgi:hypothetical protein